MIGQRSMIHKKWAFPETGWLFSSAQKALRVLEE